MVREASKRTSYPLATSKVQFCRRQYMMSCTDIDSIEACCRSAACTIGSATVTVAPH
jgi:hypothetical protein